MTSWTAGISSVKEQTAGAGARMEIAVVYTVFVRSSKVV
jgi:hypothetical protein